MIGHLYLITNSINDKVYVGKTYNSLETRLKEHIRDSKKYSNRPLYAAINKYGSEKFFIELIGSFKETELEEYEQIAIADFNSYNNGYNATLGGDGKRYLQVSDKEILDTYLKLKNADATASKLKISEDSVFKVLKANNIQSLYKRPGDSVLFVKDNIRFETKSDCARYLIDNNYVSITNIPSIVYSITRVIRGERKTYKGFQFTT